MAKIRLIGKIVTDVVTGTVGQNNSKFAKYLVEVAIASQGTSNPRLAQNSDVKKSYFAVMAFGKQAEIALAKGITVELDGSVEIAKFQLSTSAPAKDAALVQPEHTTILQGNVAHYAKAYNVLGNFVKDNADVYVPQNGGKTVYNQKVATTKIIKEQEYTSFFGIRLFGERGDKLYTKDLLSKNKVKSVVIDGSITATYTKKEANGEEKEYFNCDINVNDFQIASWKQDKKENGNGGTTPSSMAEAYSHAGTYNNEPPIEYYASHSEEISEDEIPF